MAWHERLEKWVARELADVKRVPATLIVLLVVGVIAGWTTAHYFYAERMEVLQLQLENARAANPVVVRTTTVYRIWPSVIVWTVAALALSCCVILFIKHRRKQEEYVSLLANVRTITDERDKAIDALKDRKNKYALEILEAYSKLRPMDGNATTVTVRYASYGQDYDLAEQLRGLFAQYVKWPVEMEASNTLPRADKFKVVFDVAKTYSSYTRLMQAVSDLLDMPVGRLEWVDRDDPYHVVVMVLPSVGAERIKAVNI